MVRVRRATEPREQYEAFRTLLDGTPIKQETTTELSYQWHAAVGKGCRPTGLRRSRWEISRLPPGDYRIEVTSDDGVRVWLDDALIIDNWTWHVPTLDVAEVKLGGRHRLPVEHFEIDGYATLMMRIRPAR